MMNKKYKVIIADKMDFRAQTTLTQLGIDVDSRPSRGEIDLQSVMHEADGLLVRSATTVTPSLIQQAPHLKVIGRAGIGVDNIDIKAASEAGVLVMNTPFGNAVSTAEHTIALILSVARLIPQASVSTHDGKWQKNHFQGSEITGKTLGIIGCGNIGKIVADRAQGLRMKVCVFDPAMTEIEAKGLEVTKVTLDGLLKIADFITLHTPLTAATHNIINQDAFAMMKDGVYLINAARGGLVDEVALKVALDKGKVSGVGLDVYVTEPLREHPLCYHPRVIMTPHIAASTAEAQINVAVQIAAQLGDYLVNDVASHALNQVNRKQISSQIQYNTQVQADLKVSF
ncbi:MAG: hydroxyacid dehydrogenase [Ostreibacterium sp.]